jgi:hypothetical protein
MPDTNNNQNLASDQNGKDHDPPNGDPIHCIWNTFRHSRQNEERPAPTPRSASVTQTLEKEAAPKAPLTKFVPPSLQTDLQASKTVRIKNK